ncbi:FAD-dependent oxidoreductase [Streptomyces sp. NPDC005373]|uniref:NAD(P)/FAD-dependent oxidoreductase n=1 Tax=Streptomyces sp. NPDC005373 TaxID=3156879 RepID=UPI0033ABB107
MSMPHAGSLAIVGAGPAGVAAAEELRRLGHTGPLVIVDPADFPYDRPPLSKTVLTGAAGLADIRLVPDGWIEHHAIDFRGGRSVSRLLPSEGRLMLDDGSELCADAVLLATGGTARRLPVRGADHPLITGLRTAEDALRIRDTLATGARIVVVGGGLIGAEVASSARRVGCEVTLIEPLAPPLEAVVGREVAAFLHDQHSAAGIEVVADSVAEFRDVAGGVVVVTQSSRELVADLVVVGVGMRAADRLAAEASLDVADGVLVDGGQRTSRAGIFAAGDGARVRHADGTTVRSEHWQAAGRSGRAAAAAILGLPLPDAEPDRFWSDRHGIRLEVVGHLNAGSRVVRGRPAAGSFSVFALDASSRVTGVASVADRRTAAVATKLIRSDTPVDPALLSDERADLREALQRRTPATETLSM